jgi:hypothetical protein
MIGVGGMSATFKVKCPNCSKEIKVPPEVVGKLIRCKDCQGMFEVPDPNAKPTKPAASAKPVAKPAAKAQPAAAPPPAADAPIPFKAEEPPAQKNRYDDDDDGPNKYGVVIEGEEARCPFCAKPMDPPDATICLNCGFDMLQRKRRETKAVYELTAGEYFMYWLPAIAWTLVLIIGWVLLIILWFKVNSLIGEWLETGEKDMATQKPQYYVKPWCCPLWLSVIFAFISATGIRVMYRRFVVNPRPDEKKIKRDN